MTDRSIIYTGALPQTTDILNASKFPMIGDAFMAKAILGGGTVVNGLTIAPGGGGAPLTVSISPGSIYSLSNVDATAYGDLGTDTATILKQGILYTAVSLPITPPSTSGYSQVFLVQAKLSEIDAGNTTLSYYNASSPQNPYSGPANNGMSQFTTRTVQCTVSTVAGVAAPTNSQTAPAATTGWTALYTVTVPNGATSITSGMISQPAVTASPRVSSSVNSAPFFPPLPAVPAAVQDSSWIYAVDTGAVNAMAATVYPPITSLVPGLTVRVKVAFNNTAGAVTFNLNGTGAITILRANLIGLAVNDLVAGMIAELTYDGANWQMSNYEGGTISNTTTTIGVPYGTDSSVTANTVTVTGLPASYSLSAGQMIDVKIANTNTGASTITANGGLAKAIVQAGSLNPLIGGDIIANEIVTLIYDGTQWQKVTPRNQFQTFDMASPPAADYPLQIGDQLTITFTNQINIMLKTACPAGGGLFSVEFIGTANNSNNTDIVFYPNNNHTSLTGISNWAMGPTDNGATAGQAYIAGSPSSRAIGNSGTSMFIDLFDGPSGNDNINDIGPFMCSMLISTYTAAKVMKAHGGIAGGTGNFFSAWNDITTPWTSLGQLAAGVGNYGSSGTISGVAIVKRIA